MTNHTQIDFHNDRLKEIQAILDKLAPHEHVDGMNECHICDQELDEAILSELSKLSPSSAVAGLTKLNSRQQELIKGWAEDSEHGDVWGNNEAREINLATFARQILNAASAVADDVEAARQNYPSEQFECPYCSGLTHELSRDLAVIINERRCSVSLLQRRLRYGYAHALLACRQLESRGYLRGVHAGWELTEKVNLSSPGVSSPVGGVASENIIQEIKDLFARYGSGDYTPTDTEKNLIDTNLRAILEPDIASPPSPTPSPVEHVRQMEWDTERLDWLEQRASHGKASTSPFGNGHSMHSTWVSAFGEHDTLRSAIDAAMGVSSPVTSVSSPVSSVERDTQKDLDLPGGVESK